jgi:hypothetical protein
MRTDTRADEVRRLVRTVFERLTADGTDKASGTQRTLTLKETVPFSFSRKSEQSPRCRLVKFPAPLEIAENVVIDRGRCVARSYRTDGYMAMWLMEVGILQFYGANGDMLATINLLRRIHPQRMAA